MRKEPYGVGSIVHVVKRGARGMRIVNDRNDRERFVRSLYYLNDAYATEFWDEYTHRLKKFERPRSWPPRAPLVALYAWVLMPNHFHLILEETQDGGIGAFMKKIGVSMTMHSNRKYKQTGSIFQGPYRSRTVDTDKYFIHLAPYVMVKNVFELYPGGLLRASREFEKAWSWATKYRYSSLPNYAGVAESPIISSGGPRMFDSASQFKSLARDMILGRADV